MIATAVTTAAGPMLKPKPPNPPVCISRSASIQGTAAINLPICMPWIVLDEYTNSGFRTENSRESSPVMELRRITGFTWEQLARLLGVSRRSLYFWVSGKAVSAVNEERLQRILAIVRIIDRGNANENRYVLLNALPDGSIPFDMLVDEKYNEVLERLRIETFQPRWRMTTLSKRASPMLQPRYPDELVDALQDTVHIRKGRLLSSTPIKKVRRK